MSLLFLQIKVYFTHMAGLGRPSLCKRSYQIIWTSLIKFLQIILPFYSFRLRYVLHMCQALVDLLCVKDVIRSFRLVRSNYVKFCDPFLFLQMKVCFTHMPGLGRPCMCEGSYQIIWICMVKFCQITLPLFSSSDEGMFYKYGRPWKIFYV